MKLKRCSSCKNYTLRESCKKCNKKTSEAHYKFKEKLIHQGKKYNSNIHIVTEEYTTKTCGKCGNLNHFIGSSKMFWCLKCNIEMERDYQAARNILIKTKGLINPL